MNNPSNTSPDGSTYAIALKGRDLIKVSFPATPLTEAERNEVIRRATENFLTSEQINERIAGSDTGSLTARLRDGLENLLGHATIGGALIVTDENPRGISVAISAEVPLGSSGFGQRVVVSGASTDATYDDGYYYLTFDYGDRDIDGEYLITIRDQSGDVYRRYTTDDLELTSGTNLFHLRDEPNSFKRIFIRSTDNFEVQAVTRRTTIEFDSDVTLAGDRDGGLTLEDVFTPNMTIESVAELLSYTALGHVCVDIFLANHNEIHGITPDVFSGSGGRIRGIFMQVGSGSGRLAIFHQSDPANIYVQTRVGADFINILADTKAQIGDIRTKTEALKIRVAAAESAAAQSGVSLPENLTALDRALTITPGAAQTWHKADLFPAAESELLYATLIGERRFSLSEPLEIDAITGQGDTMFAGVENGDISFYANPDNPLNVGMPGLSSHINQTEINIYRNGNASFLRELSDNFIISFDYALQRYLSTDESADLLSFGSTSTAVLGLSQAEGLYFNIAGAGNGRTTTTKVSGSLYQNTDGARSYQYGPAPDGVSGPDVYFTGEDNLELSLKVLVRVDVTQNGVSQGDFTKVYTINNLDTDQILPNLIFKIGNLPEYEGEVRYFASFNGRYDIRFRPLAAQDPVYGFLLSMSYEYTAQVDDISGVGYDRRPILSGDNRNQRGLFDSSSDNELREFLVNNVIVEIKQGVDGYMQARAVINGVPQNDGAFIGLRRTAEDLGIPSLTVHGVGNGIRLGNDAVSIARFYAIKNRKALTSDQLLQIYAHINSPGISYYNRRAADDRYTIAGIVQGYDAAGNLVDLSGGGGGGGGVGVDLTKIKADIAALQSATPTTPQRLVIVQKTAEDAALDEPVGVVSQYRINKVVASAYRKISIRMESALAGDEVRENEFNTTVLADGKVLRVAGRAVVVISENETEWVIERGISSGGHYHITEIVL